MPLTKRITSTFLLLCFVSSFTFAKGVPDDWGKVKQLKSGTSVVLITKQGAEFEGEVHLVTDDEIAVAVDDESWRLARVKRVEVSEIRKQRSQFSRQAKGGLLGGAIGVGIGAGIGGVAEAKTNANGFNDEPGAALFLFSFLGAIVGAVVGVQKGPKVFSAKGQMIYLAP